MVADITGNEHDRIKESSTQIITRVVGLVATEQRTTMHSGRQALEARVTVGNSDTSMNVGFVSPGVLISRRLLW